MIFYESLIKPNENIFNSFQHPVQNFLKQHQGQSNSMMFSHFTHVEKEHFPVQIPTITFQYYLPVQKPTHLAVLQEEMWLNHFSDL